MSMPRGEQVLEHPALNKGTAFTEAERDRFGLRGLLPYRVATLEEQVVLELEHLNRKPDDLEKYIGLIALQDRNETLFYRLLTDHLEELVPIIYTPTVGAACLRYSHLVRRPHGVWITPDDIGRVPQLLANTGRSDVRLIVATDNERILGLGDLGVGGMGIPIGKLALYTAGAGLRPDLTLPVSLDCGTDNEQLLHDPQYLGYPKRRLRGPAYDAFVEAFVDAIEHVYPRAVLQWEDFKQHNALRLLDRYRHRVTSFNDDIQGTAAVVLAGILAALRLRGEPLSRQRVVLVGAGGAGIGIARLLAAFACARADPASRPSIAMLDSRGLIFAGRDNVDPDKRPFALSRPELTRLGLPPARGYDLQTVIRHVAPTILIGTTGTAGAFTEAAVREMAARTPVPVVLPLSNPTSKCEATPADVLAWTGGRALVATGSPFDPVSVDGHPRLIGQANNVFIFPGVGLGAIVSATREVTDGMFLVAADTLAGLIAPERLDRGALYPPLAQLRGISRAVAIAVATEAHRAGLARAGETTRVAEAVDAAMWTPHYVRYT